MLEEITPGTYAWVQPDGTWWLNNAGVVVGDDAVLVVDTCATAARTRRFLDAIDGFGPIRYAVNTHQHGDHTYGNSLLPPATTIIGHEQMREGLRVDPVIDGCPPFWTPVPDWGPVTRRLPDLTVAESSTVHVGGRRVELRHPGGPAHTTGDLLAWLPEDGVIFAGDLVFAGLTPLVFMGSVPGALAALRWILGFYPSVVVPGHGPVLRGGEEIMRVVGEHQRYYELVLSAGRAGLARGLSPLEAARATDLGPFASWPDAERIVLNLHRVYADEGGHDFDLVAALTDATTFLGGPMHTAVNDRGAVDT